MEFILILLLTTGNTGSPALTSVLFPTKQACDRAKAMAEDEFAYSWGRGARAVCVPRGTP